MISNWNVLQYVANRHGKLESIFDESARKLSLVRDGEIPLISLEENTDRLKNRFARENKSFPIALERINGIANFQDKYVLDVLSLKARSVCRILKRGNPFGTGFLVAPDIIITNNHVISQREDADDMLAEFDFELDSNQLPKRSAFFKMNHSKFFLTSTLKKDPGVVNSGLDFTLIGLENVGTNGEQLSNYNPVYLDGNSGKIIKGESCVIIQHPNGLPKKIVLKDTAFFSETATCLIYESDTLPGSSGSMVLALGTCEVIALHHSGLPRTNAQNQILTKSGAVAQPGTPDDEIDWIGNEGIKISKIIQTLQEASLPAEMEKSRTILLGKTVNVEKQLTQPASVNTENEIADFKQRQLSKIKPSSVAETDKRTTMPTSLPTTTDFLITAINKPDVIERIEKTLRIRYNSSADIKITLAMPASAKTGGIELFYFSANISGDINEEAQNLVKIPDIINAEADTELLLNADTVYVTTNTKAVGAESGFLFELMPAMELDSYEI